MSNATVSTAADQTPTAGKPSKSRQVGRSAGKATKAPPAGKKPAKGKSGKLAVVGHKGGATLSARAPGVKAAMYTLLLRAGAKGISKAEIVAALAAEFTDKQPTSIACYVNQQVPSKANADGRIVVTAIGKGADGAMRYTAAPGKAFDAGQ